jgi:hypothetical protein
VLVTSRSGILSSMSAAFLPLDTYSWAKTRNYDTSTRNFFWPDVHLSFGFSRTKPYPVFDPQRGKRSGYAWPKERAACGPVDPDRIMVISI